MKKIGKITVNHFLNKNLKPIDGNKYPVYITIWFQNKLTKTRSYWWVFVEGDAEPDDEVFEDFSNYMTPKEFEGLEKYSPWHYKCMQDEREAVENIIRVFFQKFAINVVNKSPGEIIKNSLRKVSDIVSILYKDKLQTQFTRSNNIKVISARLMINWRDLSFINIYDGLFYLSNDGSNATQFYKDVLAKYDSDYELLKLLYAFDEQKKMRFWFLLQFS